VVEPIQGHAGDPDNTRRIRRLDARAVSWRRCATRANTSPACLPKAEHDADEWQAAMEARDNIADVSWGDGFAAINMPRNPSQSWSINNLLRESPCRSRLSIPMSPTPRPPIPC
jgi:hypothetical protein